MPSEVCHDLELEQQSEGKELQVSERECEKEVRSEFKYAVGLSIALWFSVQGYLTYVLFRHHKAASKPVHKGGAPKAQASQG